MILVTGASGFIGRHLADALADAGYQVVCAVRDPSKMHDHRFKYVAADFTRDFEAAAWVPRLVGIDVVINAVGILREHHTQTFDAIHNRAPRALFAACAQVGVKRIVQISALGADDHAVSGYHISKRGADDFLASLPLQSVIVQPSLVYGPGGTSARLFTMMASLPVTALPGDGKQAVQPVYIHDLVATVLALMKDGPDRGMRVPVVGPKELTLRCFISTLRNAMGLGHARFLPVPMFLMRCVANAGRFFPRVLLDPETLTMLERGNTGDAGVISRLLGRSPRPVKEFISPAEVATLRLQAKLSWLLPMLRICIALVWIVTGIVSLGLYPVEQSYALLARTGISGPLAPVMLYGAALLDLAFGVATLILPRRRWLWLMQLAVIGIYTVIITFRLSEFWLHPYGPLLKNLPMMGAIWLLLELEDEVKNSSKH